MTTRRLDPTKVRRRAAAPLADAPALPVASTSTPGVVVVRPDQGSVAPTADRYVVVLGRTAFAATLHREVCTCARNGEHAQSAVVGHSWHTLARDSYIRRLLGLGYRIDRGRCTADLPLS